MPPSLRDYTWSDWCRGRPATQIYKTIRYRAVDAVYMRRRRPSADHDSLVQAVRERRVLVTIAYADPQVIAWQVPLVRHYVPDALHVVADNTSGDEDAAAVKASAEQGGALYLRLPRNPWGTGSRSHGIAMNWVWRNVLKLGAPTAFGFLDHDIFPLAPSDPFSVVKAQDFYGVVRHAGPRWFLWAGFCFFRHDAVRDLRLDFGQDWFIGLDTGGGNWRTLYRNADRSALELTEIHFRPAEPDGPVLQWCGTWLHEGGWMWKGDFDQAKRAAVASLLAPHLALATTRQSV
jgi:hypothetical protein